MANLVYDYFKEYMADGTIDLDNDIFKAMLLTSDYSPVSTHKVKADIDGDEISGDGYSAGGATLSKTWNHKSGELSTMIFGASDIIWTNATITARYLVIYDDTVTSPVVDPLVCVFDFEENKIVVEGTFKININDDDGIFALS